MTSLHARNRIVVFRLSEEEYNNLRSACAAAGGRTLSDFTRTGLLALVQMDGRGSLTEQKFVEIDRKLDDLYGLVQRVCERIASPETSLAGNHNGSGHD